VPMVSSDVSIICGWVIFLPYESFMFFSIIE